MIDQKDIKKTGEHKRYFFRADRRLKKKGDFQKVFRYRCSSADKRLVVYAIKNNCGISRIGLIVGKKLGPAVKRNEYKRKIREAFRLTQYQLPNGYDYVLIPREATEKKQTRQICQTKLYGISLIELAGKLQNRIKKHYSDK